MKSKWRVTHLSDSLRLAVVHKYGGFYSDLDTITINTLRTMRNVFGAIGPNHLPNGNFHLDKHHPVLRAAMTKIMRLYNGETRTQIGPLFGKYLKTITK